MDCHNETRTAIEKQSTKRDATILPQTHALVDFMRQLNLTQYTQKLLALGYACHLHSRTTSILEHANVLADSVRHLDRYDDLDFLSGRGKKDLRNVANLVDMKPGHACKFVHALTEKIHVSQLAQSKVKTKKLQKTTKAVATQESYVVCIVDCSASMISIGKEVKNGYNAFVKEQCSLPGKCLATVVKFNNKVEVVQHGVDIQKLLKADSNTFKPNGTTALHDAICMTIERVKQQISILPRKPSRVIVMVLTDGAENSSVKYSSKDVAQRIKQCEERSWTFTFIGANQDAVATGTEIGFRADSCLSYTADGDHTSETWNNISANCRRQRCGESSAWNDAERMTSISDDPLPSYDASLIAW